VKPFNLCGHYANPLRPFTWRGRDGLADVRSRLHTDSRLLSRCVVREVRGSGDIQVGTVVTSGRGGVALPRRQVVRADFVAAQFGKEDTGGQRYIFLASG
jgi:hypothetical protein